jgi:hypothetical protein
MPGWGVLPGKRRRGYNTRLHTLAFFGYPIGAVKNIVLARTQY